jgi:predicted MFS family arabinose efflux permease
VRGPLEPLTVRPFGRLVGSYTLNELGDSIGVVALAVLVYDSSRSALATAALFIAARFLPGLLAPALTARLDQLALRRTLPAVYVVEALVFVALAVISDADELALPPILALAVVDGTLAVCARGLTRGAVGAVLQPAGLLQRGNALMNLGFAVASMGGAALGGVLVTRAGVQTALLADAATFLVIATLLASTAGLPGASIEDQHWLARLRGGLRFSREQPVVRMLLAGQALALVLFTLIIPIEVVYAKQSLGTTSAGYGLLLAAWGSGIVIGSGIYAIVKARSVVALILLSTAVIGLAYVGLAVAQTLAVACVISVVGGSGNGIQWIAVMTALQEATPVHLQARVTGFMESLGAIAPGIGYLAGAAITALGSARLAYSVAGAGLLVLVAVARAFMPRSLGRRGQATTAAV